MLSVAVDVIMVVFVSCDKFCQQTYVILFVPVAMTYRYSRLTYSIFEFDVLHLYSDVL